MAEEPTPDFNVSLKTDDPFSLLVEQLVKLRAEVSPCDRARYRIIRNRSRRQETAWRKIRISEAGNALTLNFSSSDAGWLALMQHYGLPTQLVQKHEVQ